MVDTLIFFFLLFIVPLSPDDYEIKKRKDRRPP